MNYQLGQHSLTGARRVNQDRIATAEHNERLLMVLADGLGGYKGSEQAAEILVEAALKLFQRHARDERFDVREFISATASYAHKIINARVGGHREGARTTCVICVVDHGVARWGHAGDSRLYHYRAGRMRSRTVDHTTFETLDVDGLLSRERAHSSGLKSHLLSCVGGRQRPRLTIANPVPLEYGDTVLLCSDGLWEAYAPQDLLRCAKFDDLQEDLEEMLLAAEQTMGKRCDNLSAIALRWEQRPAPSRRTAAEGPAKKARAPTDTDPVRDEIERVEAFMRTIESRTRSD